MRKEFLYWYPMNLRCSGKDLVGNHLTFSLYNHMAIWGPEMMPKACWTNGHVLMDGEKMSKSTGKFLTVEDSITKYSADAVRIALANAGDTNEFANFENAVADAAVLTLFKLTEWAQATMDGLAALRTGEYIAVDHIFQATLDWHIAEVDRAMNGMCFRDGLKVGFYELLNSRDHYKNWCSQTGMHRDLVLRYIRVQAVLMAPVAPHIAEHLWNLSGAEGLCTNASWPETSGTPRLHYFEGLFINKFLGDLRPAIEKARSGKATTNVDKISIYVRSAYHPWQCSALESLKELYQNDPAAFPSQGTKQPLPGGLKTQLKSQLETKGVDKKQIGMAMGFGDFVVKNMTGPESFEGSFAFDQRDLLAKFVPYMQTAMNVTYVDVLDADDETDSSAAAKKKKTEALPGQPTFQMEDSTAPAKPAPAKGDRKSVV